MRQPHHELCRAKSEIFAFPAFLVVPEGPSPKKLAWWRTKSVDRNRQEGAGLRLTPAEGVSPVRQRNGSFREAGDLALCGQFLSTENSIYGAPDRSIDLLL